jgi:hypothetical protein
MRAVTVDDREAHYLLTSFIWTCRRLRSSNASHDSQFEVTSCRDRHPTLEISGMSILGSFCRHSYIMNTQALKGC